MTLWLLHQKLTPEQETHIGQEPHVALPFGELPDLSRVATQGQASQLLGRLYPDDPPEALHMRLDRFWPIYTGIQPEDVIVVPLPERQELAIARVSGTYMYEVGEGGTDRHLQPVRWYDKRIPYAKCRKHRELLVGTGMREITERMARLFIQEQLPHSYNRFVKVKWIMGLLFALGAVRFIAHLHEIGHFN